MAEYGTTLEPGITTNVSSANTVSTDGASRSDVGIVGQADLGTGVDQGEADPNTVYQVTRSTEARRYFGDDSLLTRAVSDALNEGAYPVYATATDEVAVTGEDLSGLSSTSGTLADAPVVEDASTIDFVIDGTSKTTELVYEDPSNLSPGADEVYVNPVTGDFELDAVGSDADTTNDTVDYVHEDYAAGNAALAGQAGRIIDFFVPLSENLDARNDALATVDAMAQEYNFALAIVGAGISVDPATYTNDFDDSRVQSLYPSRTTSGASILGAYAGKRASIGISTTPINKTLNRSMEVESLTQEERGDLIQSYVVPLDQTASGPRISDDVNTVSDDNTEEANIRFGFSRLVVDFVLKTVHQNETPFVGKLNSPEIRNTLQGLINSELKPLMRSNAILDYSVQVRKIDATTASVELGVETAKPLRFIQNEIAIGGIQ